MAHDIFRAVSILPDLSPEDLESFIALLRFDHIEEGEIIVKEGSSVKAISIVCDGVVNVFRNAGSEDALLGKIGVGGFFGEINFFDPGLASASICAAEPVELATIDYPSFRTYMEDHPLAGFRIVSAMMSEMCRRIRHTDAEFARSVYLGGLQQASPG